MNNAIDIYEISYDALRGEFEMLHNTFSVYYSSLQRVYTRDPWRQWIAYNNNVPIEMSIDEKSVKGRRVIENDI